MYVKNTHVETQSKSQTFLANLAFVTAERNAAEGIKVLMKKCPQCKKRSPRSNFKKCKVCKKTGHKITVFCLNCQLNHGLTNTHKGVFA